MRITEMPDIKYADAMVIIERDDAVTWFTNECVTNNSELPSSTIFALLFRLTGYKLGLNVSTLSLRFVGAKKKPLRAYLLTMLESDPPTRLIPYLGYAGEVAFEQRQTHGFQVWPTPLPQREDRRKQIALVGGSVAVSRQQEVDSRAS